MIKQHGKEYFGFLCLQPITFFFICLIFDALLLFVDPPANRGAIRRSKERPKMCAHNLSPVVKIRMFN